MSVKFTSKGLADGVDETKELEFNVAGVTTGTTRTITVPDESGTMHLGVGIDDNATSTAVTIDSSENVGIGTSSPISKLHIYDTNNSTTDYLNSDANLLVSNVAGTNTTNLKLENNAALVYGGGSNTFKIKDRENERMRIDSSGNVLVGKTAVDTNTAGFHMGQNGFFHATRDEGVVCQFNRQTSDGEIIRLRKDGTTVGSIGTSNGFPYLQSASLVGLTMFNYVQPRKNGNAADNIVDLGSGTYRFDDVFATNGTIQTSDRNEKQDIEELSEAEQRVAIACKGLLRKFRWQDAVAEKGDDARIHFGIIAQDLQASFAAEGLDAGRYAMFISTTWYEKQTPVDAVEAVEAVEATYDDEGNELTPAVEAVEAKDAYIRTDTEEEPTEGYTERTRLGVRYPELLAFIISAI